MSAHGCLRWVKRAGCGVLFLALCLFGVLALWVGSDIDVPGELREEMREESVSHAVEGRASVGDSDGNPHALPQVHGNAGAMWSAEELTTPVICGTRGTLVGVGSNALGVRATWWVDAGLVEVASSVLETYSASGVALKHDGYLDLLGNVWSCAVAFTEGWVEFAVVDARDKEGEFGAEVEDGGCTVTVVRLGQKALE